MTLNHNRYYFRILLLLLLLISVVSGSTRWVVHAAVSVPENIRAALFINTGTSASTSLTSVATLQSAAGIALVWRDPQTSLSAGAVAAGQPVRFTMDGYRALLLETTDLNAALAVLKKVQASSSAAFVTKLSKSGKTVYQVTEGTYATAAAATSSLTKWKNAGVASGVQTLLSARIAGPWGVEAGPYRSAGEAAAAADKIGAAGLDAFVSIKPQGGALAYFVRVGQEKDAASGAALKNAAAAAGGLNPKATGAGDAYAVLRNDMTFYGAANKPVTLYAIPAAAGTVLRADPAGGEGIQVVERSKRTYRGSMEISVYNNSLAVINDVNLEHYLYSVVGTEVGASWPPEAQKAQAVAARSYALAAGMAYKIAHVVDTTVSQAYYGMSAENKNSTAGVDATKGEVLATANGKIISALFSASAGGITADPTEAWGNEDPTMAGAVLSPDDVQAKGKPLWHRIAVPGGKTGYMREDLLADAGQTNEAGIKLLRVTGDGATLRARPIVDSDALDKLSAGTLVVPLGVVPEQTDYSWVMTFTGAQLLDSLKKRDSSLTGPLYTLEVSKTGPSGRALELKVNGKVVATGSPDSIRSALGGIKSTLIDIEETGKLTIQNGQGDTRELPRQSGSLEILGGDGQTRTLGEGNLFVLDGDGQLRAATAEPGFIISGKGWGHGVGMSQWGARGLAEQGYDYQYILQYYYKNVSIEKGAN